MSLGALAATWVDGLGGMVGSYGPAGVLVTTVIASSRLIVRAQARAAKELADASRGVAEMTETSHARVIADLEAAIERRDRQIAELVDELSRRPK